jgi:hypothetical protein
MDVMSNKHNYRIIILISFFWYTNWLCAYENIQYSSDDSATYSILYKNEPQYRSSTHIKLSLSHKDLCTWQDLQRHEDYKLSEFLYYNPHLSPVLSDEIEKFMLVAEKIVSNDPQGVYDFFDHSFSWNIWNRRLSDLKESYKSLLLSDGTPREIWPDSAQAYDSAHVMRRFAYMMLPETTVNAWVKRKAAEGIPAFRHLANNTKPDDYYLIKLGQCFETIGSSIKSVFSKKPKGSSAKKDTQKTADVQQQTVAMVQKEQEEYVVFEETVEDFKYLYLAPEIIKERERGLALSNGGPVYSKSYTLSDGVKKTLRFYKIPINDYQEFCGSELQHIVHKECIAVIENVSRHPSQLVNEIVIDFAQTSHSYNKADQTSFAFKALDVCWSMLRCSTIAVTNGVAQGVMNTGTTLIHTVTCPIQTTLEFAQSLDVAASCIIEFVREHPPAIVIMMKHLQGDPNVERMVDLETALAACGINLAEYVYEHPSESIEMAVAGATESFLTGRTLSALGKLFSLAGKNAIAYLERAKRKIPHILPEHAPVAIATETGEIFHLNVLEGLDKARKAGGKQPTRSFPSMINKNSVRITAQQAKDVAKELGFKKTNYFSNGQPIFQKGNRFITIDVDSHCGGFWKMADSIKNLSSKKTRLGTFDKFLNRIGD